MTRKDRSGVGGLTVALLACLVLAAGAASAQAAPPYNLTGTWTASTAEGDTANIAMDPSSGAITGTATVDSEDFTLGGSADGTGNVTITYNQDAEEFPPDGYTSTDVGKVTDNGNCMSGTWSDSDGVTGTWLLVRNGAKAVNGACPLCAALKIASAVPARPGQFGPHPGTDVTLAGEGFCPGMVVTFGNKKATVTAEADDVSADGTSATVEIPPLATTGALSVEYKGATAELAGSFPIDSFRNTEGFQFANPTHVGNYSELASVFGSAAVYKNDTANPCAPASCPTPQLVPDSMLLKAFENIYRPDEEAGLCYGLALASLQFASGAASLANFSASAKDAFELGSSGGPGADLETFLATRFLMQYSDQAKAAVYAQSTDRSRTAGELRAEIEGSTDPGSGLLISIRGNVTVAGQSATSYSAHTMVATGVEDNEDEPGGYLIDVIDSNSQYIPGSYSEESAEGSVHAQRVTHIAVAPSGQWTYAGNGLSGPLNEIYTTPLSVLKAPLTIGGKAATRASSARTSPQVSAWRGWKTKRVKRSRSALPAAGSYPTRPPPPRAHPRQTPRSSPRSALTRTRL